MAIKSFTHTSIPNVGYTEPKVQNVQGNRMYTNGKGVFHSISFILKSIGNDEESLNAWKRAVGEENAKKTLRDAITRGNQFHELCESYLTNQCVCKYENNLLAYSLFSNVKSELNKIDNIMAIELPMISEEYGFAGKLDVLAEYNGVLSIIDFKSSRKKKAEKYCRKWFLQETAYSLLVEEVLGIPVGQLVTISAAEDGAIEIFVKQRDEIMPEIKSILKEFSSQHIQCEACTIAS